MSRFARRCAIQTGASYHRSICDTPTEGPLPRPDCIRLPVSFAQTLKSYIPDAIDNHLEHTTKKISWGCKLRRRPQPWHISKAQRCWETVSFHLWDLWPSHACGWVRGNKICSQCGEEFWRAIDQFIPQTVECGHLYSPWTLSKPAG